jgi:DNA modification methylase
MPNRIYWQFRHLPAVTESADAPAFEEPRRDEYKEFLATKQLVAKTSGRAVQLSDINPILYPFQRDIVQLALRKGRFAVFADTGLGKSFMELEWARLTGEVTLIVTELAIVEQTRREAAKLGIQIHYVTNSDDVTPEHKIWITNYERLDCFDPSKFGAVALDESSILKNMAGAIRNQCIEMFRDTPFRLCLTATPAPNDIAEIANHAEFLGVMRRVEMLAAFFVHDDAGWRLKGHAREGFYRWLASWCIAVKRPSDLGYSDEGYQLPPLNVELRTVTSDYKPDGMLFMATGISATDARVIRRATLAERVAVVADMVKDSTDQWVLWVDLNDEADALTAAIPGAVNVQGSMKPEAKAVALNQFADGQIRVLVTKPSIAGHGMNWQNAHNMAFVGIGYSWEYYYQAVRRMWRHKQQHQVNVYIVISDQEMPIYENLMSKEREAEKMTEELIAASKSYSIEELHQKKQSDTYRTDEVKGDGWRMLLGDSTERIREIADNSVDMSVFSPPFASLYTYSPTSRDLGNSRDEDEFFKHFGFIIKDLLRITKPGRNACVHVQQIAAMLSRDGYIGMKDFRGMCIRAFVENGWVYHGEVCIDKDPQAQAIRTKAKALLFTQLRKDSSWLRPALADYILIFRKPGDNAVPIQPDLTNEEWIEWARPVWYNIKESDTLNAAEARSSDDERHIAPLQLGTIERCIRLWSNPGETVFTPFGGIGSELYVAIKNKRRALGIELKPEYFNAAIKNIQRAEKQSKAIDLFTWAESQPATKIVAPPMPAVSMVAPKPMLLLPARAASLVAQSAGV